jgi:hypothetical protein
MAGCPRQPVLNIFRVFMVVRVLVRVFFFVRMRMWVFVCILTVMRVRMDMVVVMFLLCIPIVHAHHRLSDFYILLFFVPCRKPPRGMKFERDFRSA